MSAPEGKPLQTASVIHRNQQQAGKPLKAIGEAGGETNTWTQAKFRGQGCVKVPSNVSPMWCCLLAQGQQRVGWSVTAGSSLIVWNN